MALSVYTLTGTADGKPLKVISIEGCATWVFLAFTLGIIFGAAVFAGGFYWGAA